MHKYYLNNMEVACSLGANKAVVFQNLMNADVRSSEKKINLISDRSCSEMTLPFDLPSVPDSFQKYQSKNNLSFKVITSYICSRESFLIYLSKSLFRNKLKISCKLSMSFFSKNYNGF